MGTACTLSCLGWRVIETFISTHTYIIFHIGNNGLDYVAMSLFYYICIEREKKVLVLMYLYHEICTYYVLPICIWRWEYWSNQLILWTMVFNIDIVIHWFWAKTEMAMVTNIGLLIRAMAGLTEKITLILWLWVHLTCIIHSQGDNINYSNTIDDIYIKKIECLMSLYLILFKKRYKSKIQWSWLHDFSFYLTAHIPHITPTNLPTAPSNISAWSVVHT